MTWNDIKTKYGQYIPKEPVEGETYDNARLHTFYRDYSHADQVLSGIPNEVAAKLRPTNEGISSASGEPRYHITHEGRLTGAQVRAYLISVVRGGGEIFEVFLDSAARAAASPLPPTKTRRIVSVMEFVDELSPDKGFLREKVNGSFNPYMLEFEIDDYELSLKMGEYYLRESPLKKILFPHALETLSYLKNKYELNIITNGFKEVQFIKLEHSLLAPYFTHIITSEAANSRKPAAGIFDYALQLANAMASESIMIGDSLEQDIGGARNFGMDQIYFNPKKINHSEKVSFEIHSLEQLKTIL